MIKTITHLWVVFALLLITNCEYLERAQFEPPVPPGTPTASDNTAPSSSLASVEGNADGYMGDETFDVACNDEPNRLYFVEVGLLPYPIQDIEKLRARIRFQKGTQSRQVLPFPVDRVREATPRRYQARGFELEISGTPGSPTTWFDATLLATIDEEKVSVLLKCRIVK